MLRKLRSGFSFSVIGAVIFLVASCSTAMVQPQLGQFPSSPPLIGFYHKVEAGDSLLSISKRFNVAAERIRQANKLSDANLIEPGQLLYIPIAKRSLLLDSSSDALKTTTSPLELSSNVVGVASSHFIWPLYGELITRFGVKKNDLVSKGIDITADHGSFIRAAGDGIVSFAEDELNGVGKIIVIDHANGFQTVYAHNSKNLVKVGESVKRNDIIAHVGSSGYAAQPFLHFEIRKNHRPADPLEYLR